MDLDLDKEMDAMLRRAGQNGSAGVSVSAPHLDADDISAFAENALPSRTKSAYMRHLADCGDCRIILKSTIEMNAESGPEPEIVYAPAVKRLEIPWYRRLSFFPNLAYAMGGFVVLFAGFIGYSLLLNGGSGNIASSANSYSSTYESSSASNTSSNTAADSEVAMIDEDAGQIAANTTANTANTAPAAANVSSANANSGLKLNKERTTLNDDETATAPPPSATRVNEAQVQGLPSENNFNRDVIIEVPREDAEPRVSAASPQRSTRMQADGASGAPAGETRPKAKTESKEMTPANTRRVGGKRFERKQRVWYDSAYGGQSTSNVKRGSDAYKKLDRGLRSIAESLDGTVVVVWSGKAYRIQ